MKITDEMMAEAAAEMNEAMLRSLPDPDDCHHEFSRKFKRKMKRVIYRADHPVQFRIMQRVATIFLVICIGFATIFTLSPTVRATVLGWIREQYESFVAYYFEDGAFVGNTAIEYYISGMPMDYTEINTSYDEETGLFLGIYANSDDKLLYFSYSTIPENANFYVEDEGYQVNQVLVAGNPGDLYISEDGIKSNCVIWHETETNTIFYISAVLDREELLSLAESVLKK